MSPTRRDFLAASSAAALAGLLGSPLRLAGWSLAQEPVFTPIRRNVGFYTMRGGTVGYLVDPGAVVVVDSQFPDEARALLAGLNQRSGGRPVDYLINTHHHGDHVGGNVAFRGNARNVVAHARADEFMRQPPGGQPPADQLFATATFTDEWSADVGDERVVARHFGPAHTGGDAIITFQRANVAHMGDLMFHGRHPVADGAGGAVMRNWTSVLEQTVAAHDGDTVYIFGHAGAGLPVTGSSADLLRFRDYLQAVFEHVEGQVRAGRSRDEILAGRDPLRGFEDFGPFGNPSARDPLTVAYGEITGG